jgi:hypothetical protein
LFWFISENILDKLEAISVPNYNSIVETTILYKSRPNLKFLGVSVGFNDIAVLNNLKELLKQINIPYYIYFNNYVKIDITKGSCNTNYILNESIMGCQDTYGINECELITKKGTYKYSNTILDSNKAAYSICEKCHFNEITV